MAIANLTEPEKVRVRFHLGYLTQLSAASIQLGIPRASQPQFLVEQAMNQITDESIGLVRRMLDILDSTENRMVEAQERYAAEKLGEITLRADEIDALEREHTRWAKRLADILGVPLNAYSERFRAGAGASLSVPVVH